MFLDDDTDPSHITFLPVSNKLQCKKMLAQLQSGRAAGEEFDTAPRKQINWRQETEAEGTADLHKVAHDILGRDHWDEEEGGYVQGRPEDDMYDPGREGETNGN